MGKEPRRLSVQEALHWAFVVEKARLEHGGLEDTPAAVGMEYVLLKRAELGTSIDTSHGETLANDDAEAIAAVVGSLPNILGGMRVALWMVELARASAVPNWMPGAVPKCQPVRWGNRNQHGQMAKSEPNGFAMIDVIQPHPRNPKKTIKRQKRVQGFITPITWKPSPGEIRARRHAYGEWWQALDWVREQLTWDLVDIAITQEMPAWEPWQEKARQTKA
ncbi:MAG: hypothetical protein AAFR68_08260 [Pseudomonadota bacterium]